MNTVELLSIIANENPKARVYGVASTGEVVIERLNGKRRGHAHITVLSRHEAEREAHRLKAGWPMVEPPDDKAEALADLLAIITWGAELQAEVEESLSKFFEVQQMVWLHLEEGAAEVAPGPIEDTTSSNGDPEQYYPIVGTSLGVSDVAQEAKVNPVEIITELKQEALTLPVRVIEFKAVALAGPQSPAATWTRVVRKADKAAFAKIKADIKAAVQSGVFQSSLQEILPTLKVRPGFVYVNA